MFLRQDRQNARHGVGRESGAQRFHYARDEFPGAVILALAFYSCWNAMRADDLTQFRDVEPAIKLPNVLRFGETIAHGPDQAGLSAEEDTEAHHKLRIIDLGFIAKQSVATNLFPKLFDRAIVRNER